MGIYEPEKDCQDVRAEVHVSECVAEPVVCEPVEELR
jgi:hypothetical protein